ncbi:alpha/beta hydrolase [Nocardia sp. NPDC057227]|uniref:alpha/beta hydrolase n=1 Tax=Nocardia sp. NPDC057227 TaxID=3346056 RepID=UPI0036334B2A
MVYLVDTRADSGSWDPVVGHLHQLLEGRIAQIAIPARSAGRRLEPHLVVGDGEQPLVLVAHCGGASAILRWARSSMLARPVAGIVFVNPLLDQTSHADSIAETALITMRQIPTWTVTGQHDPYATPDRCRRFAEQIWGDHDIVLEAGHVLPLQDPMATSEPILAALDVAYRMRYVGGRPC